MTKAETGAGWVRIRARKQNLLGFYHLIALPVHTSSVFKSKLVAVLTFFPLQIMSANYETVIIQSLSRVWHFATPWTKCLALPSFTFPPSLLKLLSIGSTMPPNHFLLCHLLLLLPSIFPSIRVFPMSWLFTSGGQNIRASASASVLPMNIQGWFPLGLTGLVSAV